MTDAADWNELLTQIRACTACVPRLPLGPKPILSASPTARLLITSQAPGRRAHEAGRTFADASGDRLRAWLGLTPDVFYDSSRVAIIPMGMCYPGTQASGGDILPEARCSATWHPPLLSHLSRVRLTLLVGRLAQLRYLPDPRRSMSEAVADWRSYLPRYVPLPHPSWRTLGWARRNPWFEAEMLPELRVRIADILSSASPLPRKAD
ncbi:MAG: uracil-DNA glycosylase family protein [Dongiaceae bacterium]